MDRTEIKKLILLKVANKTMKFYVQCLSFLLLSFSLSAEELDLPAPTEDDYLTEIPIVLSASRLSQPESEASTSITVITREMIDASTAKNVPDLLRLVPGFQVGYFNGNVPVVTYHGMTEQYSRRIQVLIDGRSIYIPTFGSVRWSSLPITLDEIERIEVTRGPNASTYGSNSFFAVVSIKTYNAFDTQGNYLNVIAGDNHRHQALYRVGAQTENADYRLTLAHRGDKGIDESYDTNDEDLFKIRIDYTFSNNSQLFYQAGVDQKNYLKDAGSAPVHDYQTDVSYHHLKWEKTIDESSSLSLQYYYNHYKLDDRSLSFLLTADDVGLTGVPLDPFQVLIDESSRADRHDFELNYYYSPNASVRTVSGFSIRQDSVKAERLFDTKEPFITDIGRVFGHIEWRINKETILNAGLMIEDNEISDVSYSPRISLIQKITPSQSLRFGVSTATRAPSTVEESINGIYYPSLTISGDGICSTVYYPLLVAGGHDCLPGTDDIVPVPIFVSNGGLDFENIVSTEIGYHGELLDNRLSMDLKIFYNEVTDLIVQQPDTSFSNSQGANLTGLEYSLKYSANEKYNLYFSYAYIEIEDDVPAGESQIETYSMSAPENSYNFTLFYKIDDKYTASVEYFYVDKMFWLDVGTEQDAFDIINLKISRTVHLNKSTLKTSLLLSNLSGNYNDYGEYNNTPVNLMSSRIALEIELLNF